MKKQKIKKLTMDTKQNNSPFHNEIDSKRFCVLTRAIYTSMAEYITSLTESLNKRDSVFRLSIALGIMLECNYRLNLMGFTIGTYL